MGILRSFLTGWPGQKPAVKRDVEPLEGTRMSLFNSQIPAWWQANQQGQFDGMFTLGGASLAERVWVANRCQQLNAQQIASMPLRFNGTGSEPAWVSAPDPNLFPNGIGDALHAIVDQVYGWGWSLQYVTDFYSDGFPRTWTVIPSASCEPRFDESGQRVYKMGDTFLDPRRVIQIDRNPTTAAHGTSALRSFAQQAWGLMAAGNQSLTVNQGGTPKFYLHAKGRPTKDQTELIQEQWMTATANRNGAPPVIGDAIEPKEMSFKPSDLALLDTQKFNAMAIAAAYGVPAFMLNLPMEGALVYQNPASLGEFWWRFELRTTATRIGNAFTAQMLPRGSWVNFDAADTFLPLDQMSEEDDEQLSQVAKASPAQQRPLTAIEGGGAG